MKGTKGQKGITLVALIITIVVLLILAVVAISAVQDGGLIDKANGVVDKWNQAEGKEQGTLNSYESILNQYGINGSGGSENGTDTGTGKTYKVGDKVAYDSNGDGTTEEWIVFTTNNEGEAVEIISASSMGSLTLGYGDTTVNVTTDLDGDGTVGNNGDKAIASYNNAITTINNYCKSLVKTELRDKVRSVGASSDTSGDYSSTNFNSWFKNSSTVPVKAGDEYYITDYEKMQELGIASTGSAYWLASRYVDEYSSIVGFSVRDVDAGGGWYSSSLWGVYSGGDVRRSNPSRGVRLVITNPGI